MARSTIIYESRCGQIFLGLKEVFLQNILYLKMLLNKKRFENKIRM